MSTGDSSSRWRSLPSVRALVENETLEALRGRFSHEAIADAARAVLADARERIRRGETVAVSPAEVMAELARQERPRLRRVINATGVVLHTNLGRAPLADEAIQAIQSAAGYTNLEVRLESGSRGGRDDGVDEHLRALTGAERAFAVNNCAAATMLSLAAVAAGREVIVSRGELVEIGGGFRVPEVLAQSGCRLVEVGTTNRTRLSDFENAITPQTGAILRVHRSNFALVGFTEDVPLGRLASLAHERGLPLLYDQGTGELDIISAAIRAGCDLVTFSGDKLLGGPQSGIIAGQANWIERARRHPLARALRIDKLGLAGLEATLALWRAGRRSAIPALRMLDEAPEAVRARAERLSAMLSGKAYVEVRQTAAATGGGTHPTQPVESYAVGMVVEHPNRLAACLRAGEVPVMARIAEGAVLLDLRTVGDTEVNDLQQMAERALDRYMAVRSDGHDVEAPIDPSVEGDALLGPP